MTGIINRKSEREIGLLKLEIKVPVCFVFRTVLFILRTFDRSALLLLIVGAPKQASSVRLSLCRVVTDSKFRKQHYCI